MGIVLVILVLAILLIIAIVRAILKQDDNEPPCPDAELPDAEYPELQLHSGTRHEPGREIEFHSREPEQEYKTKPPPPNKITYPFDYNAPWWRDHSHWVREQKNWQCDECGISLKDNHEMPTYASHEGDTAKYVCGFAGIVYRMPRGTAG